MPLPRSWIGFHIYKLPAINPKCTLPDRKQLLHVSDPPHLTTTATYGKERTNEREPERWHLQQPDAGTLFRAHAASKAGLYPAAMYNREAGRTPHNVVGFQGWRQKKNRLQKQRRWSMQKPCNGSCHLDIYLKRCIGWPWPLTLVFNPHLQL